MCSLNCHNIFWAGTIFSGLYLEKKLEHIAKIIIIFWIMVIYIIVEMDNSEHEVKL